ncbi:MAG: type II toxin-antitoxin system VapC family toxin [Phycisphaeraceae bacterium]|nr:type II toxin-antitoxin system VapC family toxin [Phycisphaeraceae bacterium]
MSRLVIDASVLIKLHIQEKGSQQAAEAVRRARELYAPDLLWAEIGNILWKYVGRGELKADAAQKLLADMMQMPIRIVPSADLIDQAFAIAVQTHRTVYDSLYLAVAVAAKAVLLTADQRLVHALANHAMGTFVRGLDD